MFHNLSKRKIMPIPPLKDVPMSVDQSKKLAAAFNHIDNAIRERYSESSRRVTIENPHRWGLSENTLSILIDKYKEAGWDVSLYLDSEFENDDRMFLTPKEDVANKAPASLHPRYVFIVKLCLLIIAAVAIIIALP